MAAGTLDCSRVVSLCWEGTDIVPPFSWVTMQEPREWGLAGIPFLLSSHVDWTQQLGENSEKGKFFGEILYQRHFLSYICLQASVPVIKLSTLSFEADILHSAW